MNELREPLKLSDEQLRNELIQARDLGRGGFKCTGIPTKPRDTYVMSLYRQPHRQIQDLELILKPTSDPMFWSSLVENCVVLYSSQVHGPVSSLKMISNIILCALLGRKTYQDLDGDWHVPLYCLPQPYNQYQASANMPEHQLTWSEIPMEQREGSVIRLCVDDYSLLMDGLTGYSQINNDRCVMLLFKFVEPTLLERVVIHRHDQRDVFRDDQIWSIDFMEFKIYGISLDPKLENWSQFVEKIKCYTDSEVMIERPGGFNEHTNRMDFWVEIETYPRSIPEISGVSFWHEPYFY